METNETRETTAVMLSRRGLLGSFGTGLAGIALSTLLGEDRATGEPGGNRKAAHFRPRVRRVIQVFCCGGVSHLDTFDYKPELERNHGKELSGKGKIDTFFGQPGNLMRSPWTFRRRGESGLWVSDLLPHLASQADRMTFLYGMKAKSANHTPATFQMNSGFILNGFPCIGSWVSYGLGSLNDNLPAFVVLPDPRQLPAGGSINWTSGFLPAAYQGVAFRSGPNPIPNLFPPSSVDPKARRAGERLLAAANREFAGQNPGDTLLEARIRSYEMAARMQLSVPEAVDIDSEPEETKRLYGIGDPVCGAFARNCLLARRLTERGVRFIQIFNGGAFGAPRVNWDAHEDIVENHTKQAAIMDRPVAGLLADLSRRGLLGETLLLWTTEFGRTPITQGLNTRGRDHHQHGFTVWMAGAGLKPGFGYGATDEVGYYAAENATEIYDLHATVLHLLGIDHKRLSFYHNGIQRRLTDVHGHVIEPILA